MLHATTTLDPRLHIVDFNKAEPHLLKTAIQDALKSAHSILDTLEISEVSPEELSSTQALADIIIFDHNSLALNRSWGVLSHLNAVVSNDDIRHAHHAVLPSLSEFSTRLGQHKGLFNRYQIVKQDSVLFASLSPARQRSIDLALQGFELSGVALSADKQATFGEIQSKLSKLSASFSDNILDATQAFSLLLSEEQLAGLTDSGIALLKNAGAQYKNKLDSALGCNTSSKTEDADKLVQLQQQRDALSAHLAQQQSDDCYVATLDIPVYLAIMTHADDRNLRETLYKAFVTRASELYELPQSDTDATVFDNSKNMTELMALRHEKSHLLGLQNYSELSLATKMADDTKQVETFLRELAEKATPSAKNDLEQLTHKAVELGIISNGETIQPWDSSYVAEKVKQDAFSLSQEEIRPYFPLPKVIEGLFTVVQRLFDIKVVEKTSDVPLWHEDATFYQLFDAQDNLIGGFYFDLFARQGKRGGAWMSGFQPKYQLDTAYLSDDVISTPSLADKLSHEQLPVCFMVGNFTPATNGKPSLLTHDEVTTLFHEFGHGLHHLLTKVTISEVAGVNGVEWDAVELPSQFLENWVWDSEGIELISGHVETGEPLPEDKLSALLNAKNFQSGIQALRQIEFALFDLLAHSQDDALDYQGLMQQLQDVRADVSIVETPDYNRFANGFSHIFAGGYACGYFSYKWAELLSADAFGKFEEDGIFNAETGNLFKKSVLEVGGSYPAKVNFENFRGRAATIDALLRHSGFTSDSST